MAEKISTLILKVDLECQHCHKKIRKTLDKLQDREKIRTISYDEKNNKVTVSGPFDPKKLSKKLCSKACEVIKDIEIVEPKKDEKPTDTKEKPKDSKPAEQAKPEKEKPKDDKPAEQAKPTAQETVPPFCSCGPGYGTCYGGYRCGACGKTYGWESGPAGGPPYFGCGNYHFFSEEDPSAASCIVM